MIIIIIIIIITSIIIIIIIIIITTIIITIIITIIVVNAFRAIASLVLLAFACCHRIPAMEHKVFNFNIPLSVQGKMCDDLKSGIAEEKTSQTGVRFER